ncbi:MAG: hypothetical protein WC804_14775 [Sphingomonas sp.]|uniref:hypothetical protein n=1 Tax=Sphingomonas sp. TaxID=28214 RepID=UPI003563427B
MKKIVIASMIAAASLGLAACKKDAPIDNAATANELMTNEADVTVTNLGDAPVDANATGNVAAMDAPENATGNSM